MSRMSVYTMTIDEFSNGIRVLFNIDRDAYLPCINETDRAFIGDDHLWQRFQKDPVTTFLRLPTQDQERVFGIIVKPTRL